MTWGVSKNFPRAIIHVDGDAFFAACEVAKNPRLRGKPVVTGQERGIVSAATYEAKRLGITRGVPLHKVKEICPEAVILPSDYETYSLYSHRMYDIVRRYTPDVEEYGIDECFADLTGMRRAHHMNYPDIARKIKDDLYRELNITFSIGLSATKVLAKLGSKWQKPDGFTVIPLSGAAAYLKKTPLGKVWGIGPNTAAYLEKFGLTTAFDFAHKDEAWVREKTSKPYIELWKELNGDAMLDLVTDPKDEYQSISKTRTFTPPSTRRAFLYSQLSKNIENACIKARRYELKTARVSFFLKTQQFHYVSKEVPLPYPTYVPQSILHAIAPHFDSVFHPGTLYRATGITLMGLTPRTDLQLNLFDTAAATERMEKVLKQVDQVDEKYGKHTVYLASSATALKSAHADDRGEAPSRMKLLLPEETARKRLAIPFWGEVS